MRKTISIIDKDYKQWVKALAKRYRQSQIKAAVRVSVLQDNTHTDEEKENRLKQIDSDIHQTEEIMKHDLEYRGLLLYP